MCYGRHRRLDIMRQRMMIKNDRMVQFQVEPQALLDETVKKNEWCGRFGRTVESRDTNKSIRICLTANLILMTSRESSTHITNSQLKKMGGKRLHTMK
uniref:Uncharacterized protein n=1 Tax=Hyaloperonospora arabidopsidis (strain Emoy2) TaxID=559515 RepID=M4BVM8_HYAAE